jgi:succinate dehydrogenase / fumarate reductase cytochrome b subunit
MTKHERPLSPHLSNYRWPITMTLSNMHSMTCVALSIGQIDLVSWMQTVASGAPANRTLMAWLMTVPGQLLLLGWCFAFFLHLSNGVRHLFWDLGLGFAKRQADLSAWAVLASATVLTAAYWIFMQGGLL